VSSSPAAGIRRPRQRLAAEALGTFALVFVGCGAAISERSGPGDVTPAGVALAFGFIIAAMVYALGPISAAHFNPAVTLAFAAAGRFPWKHAPAYWAAQSAGAGAASLAHLLLFEGKAKTGGFGAAVSSLTAVSVVGWEAALTFLLMLVIMAVATDRRIGPAVPGLAIGLTVAACALCGGPATGASMNPARSLGPALLAGGPALGQLPLYILGACLGAVLGALVFEGLRDSQEHAQPAPADLADALALEPGLSRRP